MILVTGRPVIVTEHVDDWDALISAWWFGSEADGLADLMFGDVPFSGRLPVAWPRAVTDLPNPPTRSTPWVAGSNSLEV